MQELPQRRPGATADAQAIPLALASGLADRRQVLQWDPFSSYCPLSVADYVRAAILVVADHDVLALVTHDRRPEAAHSASWKR